MLKSQHCPENQKGFQEAKYQQQEESCNWSEAEEKPEVRGSHSDVIKSERAENEGIKYEWSLLAACGLQPVFFSKRIRAMTAGKEKRETELELCRKKACQSNKTEEGERESWE